VLLKEGWGEGIKAQVHIAKRQNRGRKKARGITRREGRRGNIKKTPHHKNRGVQINPPPWKKGGRFEWGGVTQLKKRKNLLGDKLRVNGGWVGLPPGSKTKEKVEGTTPGTSYFLSRKEWVWREIHDEKKCVPWGEKSQQESEIRWGRDAMEGKKRETGTSFY